MKTEHIIAGAVVVVLLVLVLLALPHNNTYTTTSIYATNEASSVFNIIPHVYTGVYLDEGYGLDRTIPVIINYKTTDKEAYPTMVKVVAKMKESNTDKIRLFFEDNVHMEWKATDFLTPNCFRHASYNKGYERGVR